MDKYNNVFFISDLHLGHENMSIKRGFENSTEMFQYLKTKWNSVVHKRAIVYILGDVSMESNKFYHLLDELNGTKYVVLGNHDLAQHIPQMLNHVAKVAGMIRYKKKIFLTHCPIHSRELDFRVLYNIHGHLHEFNVEDERYINVCCEQIDYTPKTLDQLIPAYEIL